MLLTGAWSGKQAYETELHLKKLVETLFVIPIYFATKLDMQ